MCQQFSKIQEKGNVLLGGINNKMYNVKGEEKNPKDLIFIVCLLCVGPCVRYY